MIENMKAKHGVKCIRMNNLAHILTFGMRREHRRMCEKMSYSLLFPHVLTMRIRSKYIIIIYLQLIFSQARTHYPYFENMNYTNKLEDGV